MQIEGMLLARVPRFHQPPFCESITSVLSSSLFMYRTFMDRNIVQQFAPRIQQIASEARGSFSRPQS
eukprot:1467774-Rhodomonas_salina.2